MPASQTSVIEAVERKKKQAGSTLPIRTPASPLGPVDMDGDEVQGGVESDEGLSSEDEAESSNEDDDEQKHKSSDDVYPDSIDILVNGDIIADDSDESDAEYVAPASPASPTVTLAPHSSKSRKRPAVEQTSSSAEKKPKIGPTPGASLPLSADAIRAKELREAALAGFVPAQVGLTPAEVAALHTDAESDEASASEGEMSEDGLDTELQHPRALTTLLYGGSASDMERSDDSDDGTYPEPDARGRKTRAVTRARTAARSAVDGRR